MYLFFTLITLYKLIVATTATNQVGYDFSSSGYIENPIDFYSQTFRQLNGKTLHLKQFKHKVVLITNVASECGYTQTNYKELADLKNEFGEDLEIFLMPSNEFGQQEAGNAKQIIEFIKNQIGNESNFLFLEKGYTNGEFQHALYSWLKQVTKTQDRNVKWNFETKFIVSKDGKWVYRFSGSFSPFKLKPTLEHFLNTKL